MLFVEKTPSLFQGEKIAVDGYLVFARVVGNGNHCAYTMTPVTENLNDKVDIYHAAESTGVFGRRHLPRHTVADGKAGHSFG